MPYSFGLIYSSTCHAVQGWERKILPHEEGYLERIDENKNALRWRFFVPLAGLDLARHRTVDVPLPDKNTASGTWTILKMYYILVVSDYNCFTVGKLLLSMNSTIVPVSSVYSLSYCSVAEKSSVSSYPANAA